MKNPKCHLVEFLSIYLSDIVCIANGCCTEKGISEVDQLRLVTLFVSLLFKRYVGMSTFHRKPLWSKFTPEAVSDCPPVWCC